MPMFSKLQNTFRLIFRKVNDGKVKVEKMMVPMSRVCRILVRNRVNAAAVIMGATFWFVIPVLCESLFIKEMKEL
ncbi:MAG: hypothetical protein JRE24_08105 [Deltaproteobacteria bacterium]|nr:hypothetical protein [Deltaproteobacteria bacterium]